MTKPVVVMSRRLPRLALAHAERLFDVIQGSPDRDMTFAETVAAVDRTQAQGLVFAGNILLDRDGLSKLPACLRVAATVSVGFDHVDVAAAQVQGLMVTNTPGVLTDCTADFTLLLMLGAMRRAREYLDIVQEGWPRLLGANEMLGLRVTGKRLGILGMGRIGQAVAQRARGFGMTIQYSNRTRLQPETEAGATFIADPDAMLGTCDVLSLHAPATADMRHWLNADRLSHLPRGAVVVNAARGSLIDEDALLAALRTGQVAAAGLDVFAAEPRGNAALIAMPSVFAAPHMASATVETRHEMGLRAVDNVASYLGTGRALDPLWSAAT